MTVNQDTVCTSWGVVIVSFAVYCLLRTLFFKSSKPRKGKKVTGVFRRSSRSTDNDPYRYHLVPLTYHDATPKAEDCRCRRYEQSYSAHTTVSCRPSYKPQRVQGFQTDEDIYHQQNGSNLLELAPLPQALEVSSTNRLCSNRAPFPGFQSKDLPPPGDLLRLSLARKRQEDIIANALNRRGKDDYTPFLTACWDCDDAAIGAFIELGADTRQKTMAGETGLVLCIYRMAKGKCLWNPRCLELLLQNGCPIDEVTKDKNTALHLAVKAGHVPATKWLLAHGATTDIANDKGWRPIAIAQAKGRKDLVQLLWECETEIDEEETRNGRSSSYHSAKAE